MKYLKKLTYIPKLPKINSKRYQQKLDASSSKDSVALNEKKQKIIQDMKKMQENLDKFVAYLN